MAGFVCAADAEVVVAADVTASKIREIATVSSGSD